MKNILKRHEQIISNEHHVYRPAGYWTKDVHKFLEYLQDKGLNSTPKPIGFDKEGREIVSFLEGEVAHCPLTGEALSIEALISAATLLRIYHETSKGFIADNEVINKSWQLPCRYPIEVMCHGDYAPYNVVLRGKEAIGIIDFDTVHPGPRAWDIAYALYRWAPLTNSQNHDGFGDLETQVKRAAIFCNIYGLPTTERRGMSELVIERLLALVDFMIIEAGSG